MRYTAPLLAAVVTVAVLVAVFVNRGGNTPAPALPDLPSAASVSPRPAVLNPLPSNAPAPVASGVARQLAGAARDPGLGAELDGEVIDPSTGTVLWARGADDPEPPASTTKLLTGTAALLSLGPDARLDTTAVRSGNTVYLVGGGDVTLVATHTPAGVTAYPRPASLAQLARQTAAALATGTPKRLRLAVDATEWTGPKLARGWSPSYVTEGDVAPPSALEIDEGRVDPADPFAARSPTPALQAGQAFATLLRHDGVRLRSTVTSGFAPSSATRLGSVASPTISQLVQRMLTTSDDDLAEALGRAVALHDHQPADFAGAAAAVKARVVSVGVPAASVSLYDTSGLSHRDRVSAQALVTVLRAAVGNPTLSPVIEGLPVAGLTGTLASRYRMSPASQAAGVVRAKTGTLTGVNTLAGQVVDRSGRLLVFAFLAPKAPLPSTTEAALDRLAARLVRCGCGVAS